MTKDNMDRLAWLRKTLEDADLDVMREMLKVFAEELMGAEADALYGAAYGERGDERVNRRNGYRERELDTHVGTIALAVPKLREGTYYPDWLLENRRRTERALAIRVREGGRVVKVACIIATAVNAEGRREIVGVDTFTEESGPAWTAFLRDLVARGLSGVRLVVSDSHKGLVCAIEAVLPGAAWQRCHPLHAKRALPGATLGAAVRGHPRAHHLRPAVS